jgi:purine-nucleoside phosphorylase
MQEREYPRSEMATASAHINESLAEAAGLITERGGGHPHVTIVAGSGLDYMAELVSAEVEIAYADIPGFPLTHARGHSGSLLLGRWNRLNIALLRGRGHYYEGYSMAEIARPVQTLAWLGARTLVVTSAVGAVTPDFVPGTLALIRDHINLVQTNPLIGPNDSGLGPRYPDLLRAYSPHLRSTLQERLKREMGQTLPEAVLAFLSGPCFETEAELKWLKVIGADLVGWSLVPEVIAAVHAGMDVLAFALVTDFSHPSNVERIDLDQILQIGPSYKAEHLPAFRSAMAVIESSLTQVTLV